MSSQHHQRIEELFERLVDEPPSERQRMLEEACGDDRELAERVSALLAADAEGHPILNRDVASLASELLDAGNGPALPGRFGRYVIREYLGEGGMGSVYLAEREDLGDQVALKFLHDPWSSPARRRRFASEQSTLAGLNHRYIARLYDAGVTNGTPWFAMEYVQGLPIVEHCSRNGAGLAERLQLFRAVCEAVSYAHRNLTIHLDLKPSNILVNSSGEVKLVDFGIARHLTREGAEAEKTATGHRLLSLNYASPEQLRGEAVDVQTDVYALGVLLYELLAGRPPADLANASTAELARLIHEEPPPLSVAVRAHRGSVMHASKAQWKELDVLCATAVRRDKVERYQTVDRLMRDLDHFVKDEPLEARTDRPRYYRLRKFVSRNRRPVAAAAAVFAAVAALTVFFNLRLIDARDRALGSEARMQRVYGLMLNLFEGDDRAAGPAEGLRVVSLLDRGVRDVESLGKEPDLQAELRYTFGGLYHKLGHFDRAEPLLVSAWNAHKSIFGPDHPRTMRTQLALAMLRIDQSQVDEAERLVRNALDTARARNTLDEVELATATAVLGKVLATEGDYTAAVPLLEQAVKVLSNGPGSVELSEALGDLANTHYYLGHVEASEEVNVRALSLDRQLFGERHPNVAVDLYNLGNIRLDHGDYDEGVQLFRQALDIHETWYGAAHPKTASTLLMLGRALAYQGQSNDASALYQRALVAMRAVYGENHPRFASVLSLMGDLARERNELDEAERLFFRAAAIFKDTSGEDHEFYLHQLSNLGSVYLARKQYEQAEGVLRTAVVRLNSAVPDQRYTGLAQIRLGAALAGGKRYTEAERHTLAGYQTLRNLGNSSAAELRDASKALVDIYVALNEPAKADEFRAALTR
jgi:eukaryotic-like serine/threonine-protein kinase